MTIKPPQDIIQDIKDRPQDETQIGLSSIDDQERKKFAAMAEQWWDENGPMRPLHKINPLRLSYVRDQFTTHGQDSLDGGMPTHLDIGCGAGLLAEPMARQGFHVTAIDATQKMIEIAKAHYQNALDHDELNLNYHATTVEDLCQSKRKFNLVTALEVIEHVNHPDVFIKNAASLVAPGGVLIISTLNRTVKSFLLGIVAAEYILRWLPTGTHDWQRFLKPSQINDYLDETGLSLMDVTGLTYNPLQDRFSFNKKDIDVNYFMCFVNEHKE